MFRFDDNHKTINEIFKMFDSGTLVVDETYQRRSVWGERDKIRLIETILLNLVIPELFFWKANTDPDTGESITHIVDGQQRIKAIASFINNEFRLKSQYLLDPQSKEQFGNIYFRDLPPEIKSGFWNYKLMIIEIDANANRDDIVNMFRRLNLTDYSLNDQEKRNSLSGEFAALARELSDLNLWEKYHLFNNTDIKRMKDVEFCGSLILLYKQGIIDQTDQTALNEAYIDYQEGYTDAETDKAAICNATELIETFFDDADVSKFLRKKTQLYTMFSVLFFMMRNNMEITGEVKIRMCNFVKLYSIFTNDMDLDDQVTAEEKVLLDWLKKYKLASSEGLNKHTNRTIRYNVLKDFLFNITQPLLDSQETLYAKMQAVLSQKSLELMEDPEDT